MILQTQPPLGGLQERRHVLAGQRVEGLLEHCAQVDHRIDALTLAGVLHHRRFRIPLQPVGEPVDHGTRGRAVIPPGKGIDPPAPIRLSPLLATSHSC